MNLFVAALAKGSLNWRRWGAAALAEAQQRDALILVVVGAACDHWSAVLAAELIVDAGAALVIDELFVPVVAEPLADPALCVRVQQALALTADARGWPACVVCLPDGRPVGATAWRPLRDRERRQGLLTMLLASAEAWVERRADLLSDAQRLSSLVAQAQTGWCNLTLPPATLLLDKVEAAALEVADPLAGGFGPPPRGPDATLTRFLIARCRREGAPLALVRQVERHLTAVVAGALHDQIGGGFHRACSDREWREVFGDKRLLDNAHWALALLEAAEAFAQPAYAAVAERALNWCLDVLRRDDGLCANGLHATSQAGDGGYYRWTIEQVAAVVGEEGADLVARRYGLDHQPRLPVVVAPLETQEQRRLPALLQRLAVARSERPAPPCDQRADAAAHGALLCALAALRLRADVPVQLRERAARLAERVAAWDGCDAEVAATPAQRAWLAIGLVAWDRPRAAWWYARIGETAAVQDAMVSGLDPQPCAAEDGFDGPGLPGLRAWAALAHHQPEAAWAVITAHAGLLRHAPLAGASLALALDQLG